MYMAKQTKAQKEPKEILQFIVQDLGLTKREAMAMTLYLECDLESLVSRKKVIKICNSYFGKNF